MISLAPPKLSFLYAVYYGFITFRLSPFRGYSDVIHIREKKIQFWTESVKAREFSFQSPFAKETLPRNI